jgi:phospholipid/cholesterol/gamma-HCH transport system ATP-binding protein
MIAQNQKRFGFTTIMISHEIPDVLFISNRILILYDGEIIFQGTHHELDQLEHPMVDEFIRSLRGFEEELKGGASESIEPLFSENDSTSPEMTDAVTVALFAIDDLGELSENLGQRRTNAILQSLDEYINIYFADVGISNRMATNEIATVLTCTDMSTAYRLLEGFAKQLQEHGLEGAHTDTGEKVTPEKSCGFSVHVGVVAGSPGEEIQVTADKARSRQMEIVRFLC